jgi:SAM-dependent methyltransferase
MRFSSPETRRTYSDRAVDRSWNDWALANLDPVGKDVVDIGCGGGIYSFGFAALGAKSVLGIDLSSQYLEEAREHAPAGGAVAFRVGSAMATGLPGEGADLVFERALIHHLTGGEELEANAREAWRLLRPGGRISVQDRTIEDVGSSEPRHWIRATLLEAFPRLLAFEAARRPVTSAYTDLLRRNGFSGIRTLRFEEVRRTYPSFEALRAEVLSRKGKSILFELSDGELGAYCERLRDKVADHALVECDAWTVWVGTK